MQTNIPLSKTVWTLLVGAALAASAQDPLAYTEVISPDAKPGEGFGWDFGGLPDLTRDGVGEFYVVGDRRVYVYDGGTLKPLYSVASTCGGDIGTHTHSAGDLNGDGIPELLLGKICANQFGQVVVVNGATGEVLFTLDSPDPVSLGFFGRTARLLPDMTGDGKEDWLIHQQEWNSETGRVYIFAPKPAKLSEPSRIRKRPTNSGCKTPKSFPMWIAMANPSFSVALGRHPSRETAGQSATRAVRLCARSRPARCSTN